MRGVSTACGACTNGSTAPRWAATRRASGGAATTSTRLRADRPMKKGLRAGAPFPAESDPLFQLGLFVLDVLASLRVELHDRHLLGHRLLVLARGVEMAGARGGLQLDLLATAFACHGLLLLKPGRGRAGPRA